MEEWGGRKGGRVGRKGGLRRKGCIKGEDLSEGLGGARWEIGDKADKARIRMGHVTNRCQHEPWCGAWEHVDAGALC